MEGTTQIDLAPRAREWGVQLPERKDLSAEKPILCARPPERVVLSLHQNIGAPSHPIVEPGQRVLKGQPVSAAHPGSLSAPVHASISGTVTAIEAHPVPLQGGGTAPCIVIVEDGADQAWRGYKTYRHPAHVPVAEVRHGVLDAGIVGLGGALFPTDTKLNPGIGINVLILNGAECEPYISCDNALLKERTREILLGAEIMLHALEADRCIVALKAEMTDAQHAVREALEELDDDRLEMAVVPNRYPAGGERQLIEVLLGVEVPSGGLPWDAGAICQNVATAAAVARFFQQGEPLISRIVTLTGAGIHKPQNIEARIGTPISVLVEMAGGYTDEAYRLVMGGPMMGIALTDDALPITKATNCILVAGRDELGPPPQERPCIRCGECARICPARLMPQDLLALGRVPDLEQLEARGILDCIECGGCDYVCPSSIPLTERLVRAKHQVWEQHAAARQADHVRRRFEAREQRLARETQERNRALDQQVGEVSSLKNLGQQTIDDLMRRVESGKSGDADKDENG